MVIRTVLFGVMMLSAAEAFQGASLSVGRQCLHPRRSAGAPRCQIDGPSRRKLTFDVQKRKRWTVVDRNAFNVSATAANIVTRSKTKSGVQREFNNEIARLGKAGQWQDALEMLQAMERAGFPPTRVSYNAALSALTKNSEYERALEMFESVFRDSESKQTKMPDSFSYAAALSACAQTRQWQRALALFREMEAAGIEPTVFTYSSLIAACERSQQPAQAAEIFEEMQTRGATRDFCTAAPESVRKQLHSNSPW